mmetsp:Transcript_18559/g.38341  ORF Transcript_18559/g.38341 Transcript_18559/m.38341 type:complete len:92 (-) Transcript_18559:565-840(-)
MSSTSARITSSSLDNFRLTREEQWISDPKVIQEKVVRPSPTCYRKNAHLPNDLEEASRLGAIALLDAEWLPCRQQLAPEAFSSVDQIIKTP